MRSLMKMTICAAALFAVSACAPMQNGLMSVVNAMPGGQASDGDLKTVTAQKLNIDPGRVTTISNRHTPAMMRLAWTATIDTGRNYACTGYYNMGNVGEVDCQ